MKVDYHTWGSPNLGHGIELKSYGHSGQPMLVFPSSQGRFYDYENNGMIDSVHQFIDSGELMVFAVDGIDWQSWFNQSAHPSDKAKRHDQYDECIYQEVVPFIFKQLGIKGGNKLITTGCSFGGYHAMNFFLRHPDVVSSVISLSGVFSVNFSIGDFEDENVINNDPIRYVSRQQDEDKLQLYRESNIIICHGQGAWEEWMADETRRLVAEFDKHDIRYWLDIWGHDVNHDWPWWRKQIVYFLDKLLDDNLSTKSPPG